VRRRRPIPARILNKTVTWPRTLAQEPINVDDTGSDQLYRFVDQADISVHANETVGRDDEEQPR
jgi:hypothetical protein